MMSGSSTERSDSHSLSGHFLIATPVIDSGFFNRSLTYLCQHSTEGAMGIVVNQPLGLDLADMLAHLEIESSEGAGTPVLAGGPVATDHGFVLHRGPADWEGSQAVNSSICLTGSRDILQAIACGTGPREYLVALGYAGWSPGQLESEMAENSWLSVAADEDILFHHDVAERLAAAGQQLGIDVDLLSAEAGHA
ncbi:MAG: YqgE/AlgH family protein [Halieaceae bacterium]|jgi:putative transcriptional regulator